MQATLKSTFGAIRMSQFNQDIDVSIPQELADNGVLSGVESEVESYEFPFDAEKISISSVPVPISRLLERLKAKTISAPQIQRSGDLWTLQQQSRLIESLMLRIPLPLFYVAADSDENWKIVDGLQRVSALRNFLLDKNFELSGLEFLLDLNGKKYDTIPPKYQNRIADTTLQFAVISSTTPPEVQRNVFKRLNTGGLPLSPQEIRHALYYDDKVASLLQSLADSQDFKKATDYSINDSRMAAKELALRFIAFLIRDIDSYPKNDDMDSFLSDTMLLLSAMPDLKQEKIKKIFYPRLVNTECKYKSHDIIKSQFILAMQRASKLFGNYAFRKSLPPNRRTPVNKALFETVAINLCQIDQENFERLLEGKKSLFLKLEAALTGELEHAISRDSHKLTSIKKRFDFFKSTFLNFKTEQL